MEYFKLLLLPNMINLYITTLLKSINVQSTYIKNVSAGINQKISIFSHFHNWKTQIETSIKGVIIG